MPPIVPVKEQPDDMERFAFITSLISRLGVLPYFASKVRVAEDSVVNSKLIVFVLAFSAQSFMPPWLYPIRLLFPSKFIFTDSGVFTSSLYRISALSQVPASLVRSLRVISYGKEGVVATFWFMSICPLEELVIMYCSVGSVMTIFEEL